MLASSHPPSPHSLPLLNFLCLVFCHSDEKSNSYTLHTALHDSTPWTVLAQNLGKVFDLASYCAVVLNLSLLSEEPAAALGPVSLGC
jgi:hypothetical protein